MARIRDETPKQLTPTAEELKQRFAEQRAPMSAATYSQKVKDRRAQTAALKGRGKPLGGAPPLDPEKMSRATVRPRFDPPPDEVREPVISGGVGGVGAAYSINQAIAGGKTEAPVSLHEGERMVQEEAARKPLSSETVEALKKMNELEAEAAQEPKEESISVSKPEVTERLEESEEDLVGGSPFDFGEFGQRRNKLVSEARRKDIESRLEPLKLEDMIIQREMLQKIIIVPDGLSVTLRTFNQRENLFCLRYVYKAGASQLYVEELLNTCRLACSLFSVNGAPLPDHRKDVGLRTEEVDKDKFEDKMFHLSSFPVQLLADLSIQMIWFNDRVNKLLSLDNLKNG